MVPCRMCDSRASYKEVIIDGTHYLNKALKDNSKIIGAKGMPELSQDSIILVQNVIDNQCQSAKQTVVLSAFVIKFRFFLWFMKERM